MSKELYEVTIDYTKDYTGESWIATISGEKYIDMSTFERTKVDLEAKLAKSEEEVKHWHSLYNDRDRQFQSVRQRYHLLNKLQSNYDKKDKLHLAYMQCAELVEENEQLKQQLAEKEKENKKLKSENHALMSDNAYQEEDIFELNSLKEYYKNNTIDFAVAELEKMKEDILLDISIGIQREWISNKIDKQIKELKEKK